MNKKRHSLDRLCRYSDDNDAGGIKWTLWVYQSGC
jgi:hypothetical protein